MNILNYYGGYVLFDVDKFVDNFVEKSTNPQTENLITIICVMNTIIHKILCITHLSLFLSKSTVVINFLSFF